MDFRPSTEIIARQKTGIRSYLIFVFLMGNACLPGLPSDDSSGMLLSLSAGMAAALLPEAVPEISLGSVTPLYSANGTNWNNYVARDGANPLSATGVACDATSTTGGYNRCLHAGVMRVVAVQNRSSCANLTARDELDALRWRCDDASGSVRFVSGGLQADKYLQDLLNLTTGAWRDNRLIVSESGVDRATTEFAQWWTNPIVLNPAPGSLNVAGTVYAISVNPGGAYTIDANGIALVSSRAILLSGPGTTADIIYTSGQRFLWIEAFINAAADDHGILLHDTRFSVVRGGGVQRALDAALRLSGSSVNNSLSRFVVAQNNKGIEVEANSEYNTFSNITVASTGFRGVNFLTPVRNTILSDLLSAGSGGDALTTGGMSGSVLTNATVGFALNQDSVEITGLRHITVMNLAAAGSGRGINFSFGQRRGTFLNTAAAENFGGPAAQIRDNGMLGGQNNYFTGLVLSGSADCSDLLEAPAPNGYPGLDAACMPFGASDATTTTGVSLAASFPGKMTTNDAVNPVAQASGTALRASISSFVHFEHPLRYWGREAGGAFPTALMRGQCNAATCRLYDWSLASGDTVLRDVVPLPTGNDSLLHTWEVVDQTECETIPGATWATASYCNLPPYGSYANCVAEGGTVGTGCFTRHLRNAIEISDDAIGNDNVLCESGEACLYTPNIGAYQGHGDLESAGIFVNGTVSNVSLFQFETNGR